MSNVLLLYGNMISVNVMRNLKVKLEMRKIYWLFRIWMYDNQITKGDYICMFGGVGFGILVGIGAAAGVHSKEADYAKTLTVLQKAYKELER